MGNLTSPIEVYFFTDWKCPACRKIEPMIETAGEKIMQNAKLFFIEVVIHPKSLDFIPYNISFMINNKPQYLLLRNGLTELSKSENPPTEEQIENLAKEAKTKYIPINYSEVSLISNFFNELTKQYKIDSTPTVVIVNSFSKKDKMLRGDNEVTVENIMNAIEEVKK